MKCAIDADFAQYIQNYKMASQKEVVNKSIQNKSKFTQLDIDLTIAPIIPSKLRDFHMVGDKYIGLPIEENNLRYSDRSEPYSADVTISDSDISSSDSNSDSNFMSRSASDRNVNSQDEGNNLCGVVKW